jgi:hypothetical protein
MQQEQLDRFKRWFDEYANGFLGGDDYVNANLRLKQEHTRRTCQESVFLAGELALDDNQTRIAELIALFHDIGRFPQFAQYRTYNDPKSVDHCRLGVEVLRQEGILDVLPAEERRWVETAIEQHGRKSLPPNLRGQTLLLAKLIRDADKLDIFHVIVDGYKRYREDPDGFLLEIELPDVPEHSPEVLEAVLHEQLIDYGKLRTLTDMKLCQLSWVYDLNFGASLRRVQERGYLRDLFSFLPQNAEMERVQQKIRDYMNSGWQHGPRPAGRRRCERVRESS